tara:strand:- start:80 stop:958 length:879 start_codon:yes stop_codon:yes gene_type:complete
MQDKEVFVIFGPTASGKSDLAKQISTKLDSPIINFDSLQVYQQLRILSSRPSSQDEKLIDHRLYGIIDGNENCTVAKWLNLAKIEVENCWEEKKIPILVGGTGLYLKGLMQGISHIPDISDSTIKNTDDSFVKNGANYLYKVLLEHNKNTKIKETDTQRLKRSYSLLMETGHSLEEWQVKPEKIFENVNYKIILLNEDRSTIYEKAKIRFSAMIDNGAIEEVENLRKEEIDPNRSIMKAIGVREISKYLDNKYSLDDCKEETVQKTRNYIKRQQTWIKSNNITSNIDFKKYI